MGIYDHIAWVKYIVKQFIASASWYVVLQREKIAYIHGRCNAVVWVFFIGID